MNIAHGSSFILEIRILYIFKIYQFLKSMKFIPHTHTSYSYFDYFIIARFSYTHTSYS